LTEAVRRRPYSVVLFDEIEKAHPDVFNIFLQVFDDGRLTDGQGRTVHFTNSVIIMTSNVGSDLIKQMGATNANYAEMRRAVMGALDKHFRPEFLNRLDDIIIFHSLGREHIIHIVDIQLERLRKMLAQRRITLELTQNAKLYVGERGFDPVYGARPLKRVLQREVQDILANELLAGRIHEGDHVMVDTDGDPATADGLVFTSVAPQLVQ
jgi:ATP-dependent Clp protease ATP-binding subunit ClpB